MYKFDVRQFMYGFYNRSEVEKNIGFRCANSMLDSIRTFFIIDQGLQKKEKMPQMCKFIILEHYKMAMQSSAYSKKKKKNVFQLTK